MNEAQRSDAIPMIQSAIRTSAIETFQKNLPYEPTKIENMITPEYFDHSPKSF